jgi:hypothetical protein
MPVPSRVRARAFDAVKALEQPRQIVRRDTYAGVAYLEFDLAAVDAQGNDDAAFQGEFEGIGQQVEHYLFPHIPIDEDRFRKGSAFDLQRQPGAFGGGTELRGEIGRQCCEIGRLVAGLHAPGLDP